MNKETDKRIRKKIFAKILDNVCEAHSYYIFTKCAQDLFTSSSYYNIKIVNCSNFKSVIISGFSSNFIIGNGYIVMSASGRIHCAVDEWDYIRTLYRCALSSQDEATINDIETIFNNFGIEMCTDDILADIYDLIRLYASSELDDGELVAWLMEFKKQRFGFRNEEELL